MNPENKCVVTREDLVNGFRQLGIRSGMALEVHSSLSAFGWVEGGADTVIDALEEILTREGTLVMPSFNHEAPYKQGQVFDIRNTPTTNGKIPDTFWRRKDVLRGMNPTHSYAAWGRNAKRYTESQQTGTGSGKDSPLERMWLDGGYVLLLGTGYRANTFHHFVEQNEGVPCLRQKGEMYPVIDEEGKKTFAHTFSWRGGHCPFNDGTPVYSEPMRAVDHRIRIGQSECILYPMQEGYPIIADALRNGANGLPPCRECPIRPRIHPMSIPEDAE